MTTSITTTTTTSTSTSRANTSRAKSGQLLLEDGSELRSIGSEDDSERSSERLVARRGRRLVAAVLAHLGAQYAPGLHGARIVGRQARAGAGRRRRGRGARARRSLLGPLVLFAHVGRFRGRRPRRPATTHHAPRARLVVELVVLVSGPVVIGDGRLLVHVELRLLEVSLGRRVEVTSVEIRFGTRVQVFRVRVHTHRQGAWWHVRSPILVGFHRIFHRVHRAHYLENRNEIDVNSHVYI